MRTRTFPRGVHPPYHKDLTQNKPIESAPLPKRVRIPLSQHIGAPSIAAVKAGNRVKVGQVVATAGGFVSVPQHASVSGRVKAIKPFPHPLGRPVTAIEIEADGEDTLHESVGPRRAWESLDGEQIRHITTEAGLTGLGGASFPTHVKLTPPKRNPIHTLILNGAECEPFLTADHRLMLERPDEILAGARLAQKAVGAKEICIGIEENKTDAIALFERKIKGKRAMRLVVLATKYPQGSELQMIKAILGVELPKTRLPIDVGVVVQNVATAYALYEAVALGKPLYERVVTVTGPAVNEPANWRVRIGTLFSDLIGASGGVNAALGKVIMGGPMMGLAQPTLEVPVVKGTSGIVLMRQEDVELPEPLACIRCARCETHCPAYLPTARIGLAVEFGQIDLAEELGVIECTECGCCGYVCPSKRPMTQYMRIAKAEIMTRRAEEQTARAG